MNQLRYQNDVAQGLRDIADAIERGDVPAGIAVVITGEVGELAIVHSLGEEADVRAAISQCVIGQHILLNHLMPDGIDKIEG